MKDVHAATSSVSPTMYDTRLGPEWDRDRSSFYRRQRLMGALLIPGIRPEDFAFTAPPAPERRASAAARSLSRRSTWPGLRVTR